MKNLSCVCVSIETQHALLHTIVIYECHIFVKRLTFAAFFVRMLSFELFFVAFIESSGRSLAFFVFSPQ